MSDTQREQIAEILQSVTSQAVPPECDVASLLWRGRTNDKAFANAIRRYAPDALLDECICAHDGTFRKTGKRGLLFTVRGFAADCMEGLDLGHGQPVRFDELTHVTLVANDYDDYPDIVLHLRDGRAVKTQASIFGRYLHLVVNKVLATLYPALAPAHQELAQLASRGYLPAMEADPARVRRLLALSEEEFDAHYEHVMEEANLLDLDDQAQRVAVLQAVLDAREAVRMRMQTAQEVLQAAGDGGAAPEEPAEAPARHRAAEPEPAPRRRGRHFATATGGVAAERKAAGAAEREAVETAAPGQPAMSASDASAPQAAAADARPLPRAIPRPAERWSRRKFDEQLEMSELHADPELLYQIALHYYRGDGTRRDLTRFCAYLDLAALQGHQGAADALAVAAGSTDRALSQACRSHLASRDDVVHRYYASVAEMGDANAARVYLGLYGTDERFAANERDLRYRCYLTLAEEGDTDAARPLVRLFLEKANEQGGQCKESELNEVMSVLEKLAARGDEDAKDLIRELHVVFEDDRDEGERLGDLFDSAVEDYRRGDRKAADGLVKGALALFEDPSTPEGVCAACLLGMGDLVHCGHMLSMAVLLKAFANKRLGSHEVPITGELDKLNSYLKGLVLMRDAFQLSDETFMELAKARDWRE